ncbi:hypothetical protein NQ314_005938 [Rhamnusium bicolor]|uniref:Uncharacterized protein n=1 Tax=Rhamnusium bicolor TaxID=1586634 RepID=A0AAV8ZBJ8_9CUCU|nr:hypothetical protein NQ314_005938 [Rhamnusium bicolor]
MHLHKILLILTFVATLLPTSFSEILDCSDPDVCANAYLFCPGIVLICAPNQEIRKTGFCGCCRGCFDKSCK